MPRRPRIFIPGMPEHIIQRGNNRQPIFARDEVFRAYAHWLKEYSVKFEVSIYASVFMTNHIHLLCAGSSEYSISKMMQPLRRQYLCSFFVRYQRTGNLWEGRFMSCLVQDEGYPFQLYRYIDPNIVRADMVNDPADCSWSSYRCNSFCIETGFRTPHPC
ncbi:transposase [Marinomonas balearica]|uniref:transposase n=1 Tax=Marinomonas balearica TaxID=491947 RepID=UPI001AADE6F8|nr:transposase [Marinomonas balearica]